MQVAAEDNPHNSEMIQSIVTDLLGNKDTLNVEFLENWLLEKERHSTVVYFEVCTKIILSSRVICLESTKTVLST